jgi:hypothetical protein
VTAIFRAHPRLPVDMGLWDRHRWGWKKTEWFSFVLIFGLLLLHPVLNGYPFLFGDSWAYCCKCPDATRSPVLGCLLRPAVLAAGNWGYVVIQCAAAAFAFAFLSGIVLKRNHPYALVVSLLVSGAGIFAGWILADIWTLIGLICLLKRMDMPLTVLLWLSTLICLASAMACWQARYEDTLIQLAMFALMAVVVNAFFMSNISGVFSRYHTRVDFLLIFPGVALSCRWIGLGIERIHLRRQA